MAPSMAVRGTRLRGAADAVPTVDDAWSMVVLGYIEDKRLGQNKHERKYVLTQTTEAVRWLLERPTGFSLPLTHPRFTRVGGYPLCAYVLMRVCVLLLVAEVQAESIRSAGTQKPAFVAEQKWYTLLREARRFAHDRGKELRQQRQAG